MIDAAPLGQLTAKAMDDLETAVDRGELPADTRILAAMVVLELHHTDDTGDTYSTVTARVSEDRSVIGLGLAQRAAETFLRPDGDLAE